jgi:hypothetical protein
MDYALLFDIIQQKSSKVNQSQALFHITTKKPPTLDAQVASSVVRTLTDYSALVAVNFPPSLRPTLALF